MAGYNKGGGVLEYEIEISSKIKRPYVVIHTNEITDEIQNLIKILKNESRHVLTLKDGEKFSVLPLNDIYMVRVEEKEVMVYCEDKKYISKKRLYELEESLGNDFLRISKSTIINLNHIKNVVPSFKGVMYLNMKNGSSGIISRKYLPEFKRRLGL